TRFEHGEAVSFEPRAQHEPDIGFVVRDQDALVRHLGDLRCRSCNRAHRGRRAPPAGSPVYGTGRAGRWRVWTAPVSAFWALGLRLFHPPRAGDETRALPHK